MIIITIISWINEYYKFRNWDFIEKLEKKIVNLWKTLRKNIEKDNILEKIIDKLSLDRDNKPKQLHQEFLFRKLIK